ncbi:MAG TPA: glycosyltransferase family 1 protein [Anaerolineae bacterium]|nr:glycosyltransferase family 1 protein [Anaerolineae bacterium]
MHIAIDAHMVGERETGNETYTLNLARALLRLTGRDPKGFSWDALGPQNATQELPATRRTQQRRFGSSPRFFLLATHPDRLHAALPELRASLNAQVVGLRPANALLRIPFGLPWAALRGSFDLLHVTYNAPPLSPCPTVVTIHDISFEHYPQFFSLRDLLILKTLTPLSARRAAHILTVSQHAKQEIIDRYGLPPDKITVTYEAASEQFQPVTDPAVLQAVRVKYGIGDGPFVLALGNLQPRKNIARLVKAFAQVAATRQSPSYPVTQLPSHPSLVIAGKAQWRESEVFQAVQQAGLEGRVVFPGYVDDADLPALYSAATVFVYPSLYEGFGLPPLEAMACGTPVISSNAASLPEVVGDAALLIDPTDTAALARALHDVLTQPALQADLRARGLRRAAMFSWERCATETLEAYQAALRLPRGGSRG